MHVYFCHLIVNSARERTERVKMKKGRGRGRVIVSIYNGKSNRWYFDCRAI